MIFLDNIFDIKILIIFLKIKDWIKRLNHPILNFYFHLNFELIVYYIDNIIFITEIKINSQESNYVS